VKRLVEEQGGKTFVRTVVLADDEVAEQLVAEALLHRLAGWDVAVDRDEVVCSRGRTIRRIYAVDYDPMEVV
jgi:hypothetical protein